MTVKKYEEKGFRLSTDAETLPAHLPGHCFGSLK